MMLKCMIIDDEPSGRKVIEEFVNEADFLELIATASNPFKAIPILNSRHIDLIFLDVQMPKINGLDFLKSLKNPPMAILTTAFPDYAIQGYELDVIDYLLKPISLERFLRACNKALEFNALKKRGSSDRSDFDYFFIKCNHKFERVLFNDLLYIEAADNYVILQTKYKRHITYLTFKGIADNLPAERFMKVHKSYIVAIDKIETVDGEKINLGSHTIPISRGMRNEVMVKILNRNWFKR